MRTLSLALASLLLLAGCGGGPDTTEDRAAAVDALVQDLHLDYPGVVNVSPRELMSLLEEPDRVVLVDVRTEGERGVSTIPGAISRMEFESSIEDLGDRRVVAYCTIGARSSQFAREMAELGIEVANLDGSILAWTHAGGPLVSDGEETNRLHVYGSRWNLVPAGYEAVW